MNIEILKASVITEETMKPKLLAYFIDKNSRKFYEFNKFVSNEFIQDVYGGTLVVEEALHSNINDCIQVTPEYMLEKFNYDDKIKQYVTSYIRDKKIDSIITK